MRLPEATKIGLLRPGMRGTEAAGVPVRQPDTAVTPVLQGRIQVSPGLRASAPIRAVLPDPANPARTVLAGVAAPEISIAEQAGPIAVPVLPGPMDLLRGPGELTGARVPGAAGLQEATGVQEAAAPLAACGAVVGVAAPQEAVLQEAGPEDVVDEVNSQI